MAPDELPRLGIRAHGGTDPQHCVALARAAEAAGFASMWFAENPFERGVFSLATACLLATRLIRAGLGIVNPYMRHPAQIAMEFAALEEVAPGRVLLGIGSGIGAQIERLGFHYRPVAAMDDAMRIVRGLLRGETVHHRGTVFSADDVALRFRPLRPDPPIYMAAMGDRSLALCGRIADGLIVSNMCPLGYTQRAIAIVDESARQTGRPMPGVVQYVPCVARPDGAQARAAAKIEIGAMLARFWPAGDDWPPLRETIVRHSGISKTEVVDALARLRRGDPATDVLDDRFADAFAIAGTAAECLATAARFRRTGVSELALTFAGNQPATDMAYLAAAVGAA
ncbi:MAG TPA: LLM class flavin-dependent oxidoreductase [Acetobacteraceae bacterium]|nr:LLM class flavin-dependent oxidoreductase [Acetobacteraceae bacterium]